MTPPFLVRSTWRRRLALLCTRQVIGKALLAAVLVGSLLVFLHQGDVIFAGQITGRVVLKMLLTPLIPFCVTMLGALLNSSTAAGVEALRPGWKTVRRSLMIAAIVGGMIIALNQGDVLYLLRASSAHHGTEINLSALTDHEVAATSGVEHGALLIAFAEAMVGEDDDTLTHVRHAMIEVLSPEAMVDAAGVASSFERMMRIADSTGIPLFVRDAWVGPAL